MNRFWRINVIWRKELTETLRDRRTMIAMVFVPMVLYPMLMLGSLQAMEVQITYLRQEEYLVAVADQEVQRWLNRLIDSDPARRSFVEQGLPAEEVVSRAREEDEQPRRARPHSNASDAARAGVRDRPPPYKIIVIPDVEQAVISARVYAAVLLRGSPPDRDAQGTTQIRIIYDDSDVRSGMAADGLAGIMNRANAQLVQERLQRFNLDPAFINPLDMRQVNVASAEQMAASILGQIVPLILVIMTITGAIYPAIDLTAGERERGTLETLMVAPVPAMDLIAGKFIVVTLIGMLSAVLNLVSIGGTIYLGGLGQMFTQGADFIFPFAALPWILLLLIPLAVMFSAMLLAVSSFARSFKEAQNYIMPVMVVALVPAVVGILPGTRLEGPLVVMPVANIVILTRELFMGRFDYAAIAGVVLTTSIYAGAAVAVAAKLFGQEAVLFADSGSVRTLFQRKFFRPTLLPSASQALLMLALVYPLNFFIQQQMAKSEALAGGVAFFYALALVLLVLFVWLPLGAAKYMRVNLNGAFALSPPRFSAVLAALCFGCSTWLLARVWYSYQEQWLPMLPEMQAELQRIGGWLHGMPLAAVVLTVALVPALCEEFFFRGYVLSGLRSGLGKIAAVVIVALAFGIYHQSVHRFAMTVALGLLFGLLVIQFRSVWPAMIAHLMHNALVVCADPSRPEGLYPLLKRAGFSADGLPPQPWIIAALLLVAAGILLCLTAPRAARPAPDDPALDATTSSPSRTA